jgi:hypothetical protein
MIGTWLAPSANGVVAHYLFIASGSCWKNSLSAGIGA